MRRLTPPPQLKLPCPSSSTAPSLKGNFTQLEIKLVQLKELVLTQLCSCVQTLQDQISKLKKEHESAHTVLLKELQRDREALCRPAGPVPSELADILYSISLICSCLMG
ncbi:hypothetical protein AAFF_G00235000 [Aldrovandia affinis]|uniref:Uncharacterized protein n=1 Tax=Aldrovandia affinis TaxID=143900 RepID=A0AAD7WU38_9TELE|nr:hypothetical protein AAFF_G00235000 [Aldrovandia affinis]